MIAVLIDFVMLFLAKIPIDQALSEITPSPTLLTLISYGIAIVYSTVFLGSRGQTPGKTMASLRVISVDGSGLNQRQALVRSVLKWSPIYAPLFLIAVTLPIPMTLQDATVGSPIPPPAGRLPVRSITTSVSTSGSRWRCSRTLAAWARSDTTTTRAPE